MAQLNDAKLFCSSVVQLTIENFSWRNTYLFGKNLPIITVQNRSKCCCFFLRSSPCGFFSQNEKRKDKFLAVFCKTNTSAFSTQWFYHRRCCFEGARLRDRPLLVETGCERANNYTELVKAQLFFLKENDDFLVKQVAKDGLYWSLRYCFWRWPTTSFWNRLRRSRLRKT